MSKSPENFFGRESELQGLTRLWEESTSKDEKGMHGGPRMAIIIAETGYGKTRLIQAFYQQLTCDPVWDPSEFNYWPDAFQDVGSRLRVNPDMTNHKPNGPPRFLWAGMRWSPPNERNIEERTCSLPEIRNVISTHVGIARDHAGLWTKIKAATGKTIHKDGVSHAADQLVDWIGIPFMGLLLKGAKAIGGMVTQKALPSFHEESEKKALDITEELLGEFREVFGSVGSGGIVLPTLLFLDDAQWVDPITLRFLERLWREAESKKWPLLVLVTHWERNWRELLKRPAKEQEGTLAFYDGKKGVHVIGLGPSSNSDLWGFVSNKLPGLTENQKNLLLEKADGNFLTLEENVGFLLQSKMNFENGTTKGKLSKGGENKVRTWEENRQKRIEQMFAELSDETKNLLGWSGQLGIRFIENVVVDFAKRHGVEVEPSNLMAECIDPLVILGKTSENLREFRHRAFYHVASQYFKDYLSETELLLKQTLQDHLSRWLNNSFTREGDSLEPEGADKNIQAAILLESGEQRDLLNMAVQEFMPKSGDKEIATTWLRAVALSVRNDAGENLWDLVRQKGNLLLGMDWNIVPENTLSLKVLKGLAGNLETSGSLKSSRGIRQYLVDQNRIIQLKKQTPESLRCVAISLGRLGDIEETEGNLQTAKSLFTESLDISKKLAKQLGTTGSLLGFSNSLDSLGDIEKAEGNLEKAKSLFYESRDIRRKLAEQLGTPGPLRDLAISIYRLGDIEAAEGNLQTAKSLFTESLDIARKLAKQLGTPESLNGLAISLGRIGEIEKAEGNMQKAKAHFKESFDIRRKLAGQLGTPESIGALAISLDRLGDIEAAEGNLQTAKSLSTESLDIAKKLAEQLGTPESLRALAISLDRLGAIEAAEGNLQTAKSLFTESLDIAKKLAKQLGTPESLNGLAISLGRIGEIEKAEGNMQKAKALFKESFDIRRKLAGQLGTPESLRDFSYALRRLGRIEETEGNLQTAKSLITESLEIARKLAKQLGTTGSLLGFSNSLESLGDIEKAEGNMQKAKALFKESFDIRRKLAGQLGTPKSLRDVSLSLRKLGDIEKDEGNLEEAKSLFTEALEIDRKLLGQSKTLERINVKIWASQKLAKVLILLKENREALNLLIESEPDALELEGGYKGNLIYLDTLVHYWERRAEIEKILGMKEHECSLAKAVALKNLLKEKEALNQ